MRNVATLVLLAAACASATARGAGFRVAPFEADITIPLGHACMGGGIADARRIVDRLYAKGFVFLGDDARFEPIVVVALDWCQSNNDSYDRWRDALAAAAGTTRVRVMLATVHQHDAPIADLRAQAILDAVGLKGSICDAAFHERAVRRTAAALKAALATPVRVTHVGVGKGLVERVASNRRVAEAGGRIHWERGSADTKFDDAADGEVDPYVRTISLWDGDRAVVAWSCFAVHPMSHYGNGEVSADFVGRARAMRQADDPRVFQLYFTGCAGDVTAGKYNDGRPDEREALATRLHAGMVAAWRDTVRTPLNGVAFRSAPLRLPPRDGGDFGAKRMRELIGDPSRTRWERNRSALGLSWRERVDAGRPIDVPCADFGPGVAQFAVMPAETFVGYQIAAQRMRADGFVVVAGFGDGAPGYIPTDACVHDGWNDAYSWVAPPVERALTDALAAALARD